MATTSSTLFELTIGKRSATPVVAFRGREGLSKLYAFDVTTHVDKDDELLTGKGAGERATLAMNDAGRMIHGIVAWSKPDGAITRGSRRTVTARIVPALWLGRRRVTSRIFQDMHVPAIVKQVLTASGVPHEMRLQDTYPVRNYCLQYQESDYQFVRRILFEEGIYWMFDHDKEVGGVEKIIFIDRPVSYGQLDPNTLHLRERDAREGHAGADDDVLTFARGYQVTSNSVLLRDYDYRKPLLDLNASAQGAESGAEGQLRIYQHRGEYDLPEVDPKRAQMELEQYQRDHEVGRGTSACRRLQCGLKFKLEAEAAPALAGEFVAIEVKHRMRLTETGASGDGLVYQNTFECVPADVAHRPPHPKPKVKQVLESATVVGPPGEEVHTDYLGRIKVQFHWDLQGSMDDKSSTWLRVVQPWTGATFGTQFIPRIGTEVMVSFLGGDEDCPVAIGCVYNATHPPPFQLPEEKLRSGVKTRSSPGGQGHNELSFKDAAGQEQIRLHAQRDFDSIVERDYTLTVNANENVQVKGNLQSHVHGDAHQHFQGADQVTVGGDAHFHVAGGSHEIVMGHMQVAANAGRNTRVQGLDMTDVTGISRLEVGDDRTVRVFGCHTTLVGTADEQRHYLTHVEGKADLYASDMLQIKSPLGVRIHCGQTMLEIGPDNIRLTAQTIELHGPKARVFVNDDSIRITAQKEVRVVCQDLLLKTDQASLGIKSDVQVDGQKILLNSPNLADDPVQDTPDPPTEIDLVDANGKPIPNQQFVVALASGGMMSGFLDQNGHAELDIDEDGSISFPGLLDAAQG